MSFNIIFQITSNNIVKFRIPVGLYGCIFVVNLYINISNDPEQNDFVLKIQKPKSSVRIVYTYSSLSHRYLAQEKSFKIVHNFKTF